jgi:hypothetical protein
MIAAGLARRGIIYLVVTDYVNLGSLSQIPITQVIWELLPKFLIIRYFRRYLGTWDLGITTQVFNKHRANV